LIYDDMQNLSLSESTMAVKCIESACFQSAHLAPGHVNVKWPRRDGSACRRVIGRIDVPAQVMNQR